MANSRLISAVFVISIFLLSSCSSLKDNPMQSEGNLEENPEFSSAQDTSHSLIGVWTADFDIQKMRVDVQADRNLSVHYNATNALPPPIVYINSYDPVSGIADVDISIENTFALSAYDVRLIIFTDDVGHMLLNPDDWTGLYDVPGGIPINPFKAYHEAGSPDRVFPGLTTLTENLQIFLPSGNTAVKFAIDASVPSNCEEPYDITNFTQDILWSYSGATANISVTVNDWQDDVNSVELYCPQINGGTNTVFSNTGGDEWQATLVNTIPTAAGDYQGFIIAKSGNSGSLALYDEVYVAINHINILFVDDDNTAGPWDGSLAYPFQYVQDAVDVAIDNSTIWIKPGVYNEDEGGTGGEAEITINGISDLTFYGEGMPEIFLHTPSGGFRSGLAATDCPGLTVEGLAFTPSYLYGATFLLANCPNSTIRNCKVTPYRVEGFSEFFRATNSDNLVVERNEINGFQSSMSSSYLFSLTNCNNSRVSENTVLDHYHRGGNVYYTTMVYMNIRNCDFLEISKNVFGNTNRQNASENWVQLELITVKDGTDIVIRNNLFHDLSFENTYSPDPESHNYGITCINITNLEIFNNTIDSFGINQVGVGETFAYSLNNCPDSQVYNNIVSNINGPTQGEVFGIKSDLACNFDYSNVWNLIGGTITPFGNLAVKGPDSIELDPMFTDPVNDIYTLLPGSPCEGEGLNGDDMGCYGGADPLP